MNMLIEKAKEIIASSEKVTVLTGAGISAESGVPTFRGKDGLWHNYRATDLATPEAFERDPSLVWEFYNWRRSLLSSVTPNNAHEALARFEKTRVVFTLITQNIDGLHGRAGSKNVLEIHGNIWKMRCTSCGTVIIDYRGDVGSLPRCDACGALMRPDVVWFGESLNAEVLTEAFNASRECSSMIVVGTSAVVQPAAFFPYEAKHSQAFLIEINPEATPLSGDADISLRGTATECVPLIFEQ